MSALQRARSTLHLQMGQETLYLLLTSAIFATIVLIAFVASERRPDNDPPIITLPEDRDCHFESGSSTMSAGCRIKIHGPIAEALRKNSQTYDATTIEVIGHTDEIPLPNAARRSDNLDVVLIPTLAGQTTSEAVAGDNVGLGMARAVAVARELRDAGFGGQFTIIPLSAGAFLKTDDTVTDGLQPLPDVSRRRIEIRLRRPPRR